MITGELNTVNKFLNIQFVAIPAGDRLCIEVLSIEKDGGETMDHGVVRSRFLSVGV